MTPAVLVPAAGPPELRAVLERARRRPRVTRATPRVVAFSTLRPWRAQRHALRSDAPTRVVVAGRQGGKTLMAAFAALRVAFARPGSLSALLVPGYRWAETAIARLVQVAGELPGVRWKEQKKKFVLPNGATIEVFSADRKDGGVRGPTITGIYWIDEGAYVPEAAYDSGNPAQIASKGRLKLVTTTPAGKNWVWQLFAGDDPTVARFRFRSEDAPHTDKDEIARLRRAMTPERAAQEFDAVFVDDLLLAFPSVDRLFVDRHLERRSERDVRNVLGIDLGKEQDWLVVTLMNRHGEAQILGRWRHVNWTETLPRLTAMARTFGALVVLDHGAGGGYGGVAKDHLEKDGVKVLAIKTAVVGTKAQVVEQCRADVQWERIKVLRGEHADQLRHELTLFQGIKRQLHGQEVTLYEGPQIKGEHDDCVISLCLANWGRVHGEHALVEEPEDLQEWVRLNERLRRQFPYRFVSGSPASGPFFGSSPFFGGGL